jgi:Nucleotidyl transferase AbiEii toxin, Type IV TA system
MSPPSLAEKVLAITGALREVPHAFGGALALAYYAEPRATIDIDLNVFVSVDRFPEIAERLAGVGVVTHDDENAQLVARDGQARVWWGTTPVDLFFAYDRFHDAAAGAVQEVPFADATIAILAPEHLVVCKVVFNRAKDWVDIDAMLDLGTDVDAAEVLRWVGRIAGDDDARFDQIADVLTRHPR